MRRYHFNENQEVNDTLNLVINKVSDLANKQIRHIRQLTKIGQALSSENSLDRIFDMILEESLEYTNADGATIYTVSDDKKNLDFKIVYNHSMNLRLGGSYGSVGWPSIPLYDPEGNPRMKNMVTYVYHTKTSQSFDDIYKQNIIDASGTRQMDERNQYRSKSMLAIPLKNHEDEVLGVIQLINAQTPRGRVTNFTPEHQVMMNSMASQAAIALSNKKLIQDLEKLLHQFIQAIASALDRKSKYTGGHITRVATLTELLAKKINEVKEGHFSGVKFTDIELEEISLSGWMHDMGKIITPEFVMDKSTKLEKMFDRIEVVTLRFELLILALQHELTRMHHDETLKNESLLKEDYQSLIQQLQDDMDFVKKVNIGGEFLADSDCERIKRIADFRMTVHEKEYFLLTEDERDNLLIRKGTLTPEEFRMIQDHVSVTWEMLSRLSFPKKFRNVPLYASSHHEKLNGKGYPFGYKAEDLPLQGRIIAVADIFEALTAADRPYKKANSLSAALKILAFMARDRDIDPDLVDFLIDSGLYREYGELFLPPELLDEVNIMQIKSIYHEVNNR